MICLPAHLSEVKSDFAVKLHENEFNIEKTAAHDKRDFYSVFLHSCRVHLFVAEKYMCELYRGSKF